MENFYKKLSDSEKSLAAEGEYNFDHPEAFDWPLFESCLQSISHGCPTNIPTYDYNNYKR